MKSSLDGEQEKVNLDDLLNEIKDSECFALLTINENNLRVRTSDENAFVLIAELLNVDRKLFQKVCNYIKLMDEKRLSEQN